MTNLGALEAYNQYITQYNKQSKAGKEDLHGSKKLKEVSGSIQKKNSQAPIFLDSPSSDEVLSALILKNDVYSYHQDISKLYSSNPADPFMQRYPYVDNEKVASISLTTEESDTPLPSSVSINIEALASPQTNIGAFLKQDDKVLLPPGNYSFDLVSQKYGYEIQFDIYPDDKNLDLQNRISNLINKSNLGITSTVLQNQEDSALCMISNALGKPVKGDFHFTISDDNTSQTAGVVKYLDLNSKIAIAQNAKIQYDDAYFESYDNTFKIYDRYELKLNRENISSTDLPIKIEIGFYPDIESLIKNIEGFVDGYNELHNDLVESDATDVIRNLDTLVKGYSSDLAEFGITRNQDKQLEFNIPPEWNDTNPEIPETDKLTLIGNKILKKLLDVSVDPMVHLNRKIGIYQNPSKKEQPTQPYLNYYGGLIFHKSV